MWKIRKTSDKLFARFVTNAGARFNSLLHQVIATWANYRQIRHFPGGHFWHLTWIFAKPMVNFPRLTTFAHSPFRQFFFFVRSAFRDLMKISASTLAIFRHMMAAFTIFVIFAISVMIATIKRPLLSCNWNIFQTQDEFCQFHHFRQLLHFVRNAFCNLIQVFAIRLAIFCQIFYFRHCVHFWTCKWSYDHRN